MTALTFAVIADIPATRADEAGAFIGGVVAAKVANNMRRRTEAEEQQAYYAQQQSRQAQQVPQATAPASRSAEERLEELDQLAAKGYITQEEYKARRQQILEDL
jgi:membrane protease subunit (stomatin/prohibitin family)